MNQIDATPEQWRPVPDWPYEASNLGRIRRTADEGFHASGSIVEPWVRGQFYPMVALYRDAQEWGARDRWLVAAHRVIAETWLGARPDPKWEVDHIDGDKLNARVDNLRWVSASDNIRSSVTRGHRGSSRWNATLTEGKVRALWVLRGQGWTNKEIAEALGVGVSAVTHVVRGDNWKHIKPESCGSVEVEEASLQEALRA